MENIFTIITEDNVPLVQRTLFTNIELTYSISVPGIPYVFLLRNSSPYIYIIIYLFG